MLGNFNLYYKSSSPSTSITKSNNSSVSSTKSKSKEEFNISSKAFNFNYKEIKNSLLYNTSSIVHLVNSKEYFIGYIPYKKGKAKLIITSRGPIYPKGYSNAKFLVLSSRNPDKYRPLILKEALYFLSLDIKIISRLKHYILGGYIIKNLLFLANRSILKLNHSVM